MSKPKIRFNGFTEDWEQRKLGEIVERVTRKNQDLVSELPLTISAQYGLIDQNEFFDKRVASKDVSGYYLIYNGEFAYNKSTSSDAPWGAIKRLDRYENGVLSTLYIVFKIKDEEVTSSDFVATYYDTSNWHKEIQAIAAEGARNHGLLNIAPNDFFQTKLMVPQDIDEQQKIGNYFKMLNDLITLHQRKCEQTKKLKKFMLQKMFPQNGKAVPEIRFNGFTEDWEQRKLEEICIYHSSSLIARDIDEDGIYDLYDANSLIGKTNKGSMVEDYITIIKDGAGVGRTRLLPKNTMFLGTMGALTPQNSNLNFLFQLITNADLGKEYTGSTIPHIYFKDYGKNRYCVPCYDEQHILGVYFSNLDHLITLHQRKCDELQNMKKFMLQNMFV